MPKVLLYKGGFTQSIFNWSYLMSGLLLAIFDLIGTVAFSISGAITGIQKKMDIFGVNILAILTACGGGLIRDIVMGDFPPISSF